MHNKYIFTNIVGTFIFNEHFNILDKKLFKNIEQYQNKEKLEKEFSKKYTNLKQPEGKELKKILLFFKSSKNPKDFLGHKKSQDDFFVNKEFFDDFYKNNLKITKAAIKESVKDDLLIIQTINNIGDIDKTVNILIKRLREWYALYNPEFENALENQEKFVELILKKNKSQLLKEIKINEKDSMGADLSKDELEPIMNLAKEISQLFQLREKQELYLNKLMKKICPNLLAIAGDKIGAKLLEQAGSLKNLMLFPASTIQILGAEKALFRHMKTGAKSPRHGFIVQDPLISSAPQKMHGKIARAIADKIAIAVKVDYFKGKFIGDELRKGLEDKFKK